MDVDFVAVCDAIRRAWAGSGETVTSIAVTFGSKKEFGGYVTKGQLMSGQLVSVREPEVKDAHAVAVGNFQSPIR